MIGGFPNEIKTKIRYLIICCYHIFIKIKLIMIITNNILVLFLFGNPPFGPKNKRKVITANLEEPFVILETNA